MEIEVTPKKWYVVSGAAGATVSKPDGTVIATVPEGGQAAFMATTSSVVTSDDAVEIVESVFKGAPAALGLLGGGNSGGSGGGIEGDYLTFEGDVITGGRLENKTQIPYLCKNVTAQKKWNIPLPNVTNVTYAFYATGLSEWNIPLPNVMDAKYAFYATGLREWNIPLPKLVTANSMFQNSKIEVFNAGELSELKDPSSMFSNSPLRQFDSTLPAVTGMGETFSNTKLTEFTSPLPNFTAAWHTFSGCTLLENFESELPKLTQGDGMFTGCKLNKASAIRVLTSIPAQSSTKNISIGIHIDHQNDAEVLAAIEAATAKKWRVSVQWNGTASS